MKQKNGRVLVVIAVLATLLAIWYGRTYWLIVADGATAPAVGVTVDRQQVLGKTVIGDPNRYFASYRFVDEGGREHSSRQTVSRDLYEALSQGDIPLQVHYSRAHPDVNVLDLEAARWASLILAALAALAWIAALLRLRSG